MLPSTSQSTLTTRTILAFWLPLAGTWLMMALEGPFVAAVIARLPNPIENLAAFGVAFAIGMIVESPVIMLMSAAPAIVRGGRSYFALRRFAYSLNVLLTITMAVVLVPAVFRVLAIEILRLPPGVARLTHQGVLLLLPWPAAIGYRRFHQGLLIRHGLTRWVAYGTIVRISSVGLAALVSARTLPLSGVHVGSLALSVGVLAEAVVSRWLARDVVRELRADRSDEVPPRTADIARFYLPLALTSVLGMGVQPLVTFFMGQSRAVLPSLAVLPVIHGLTFLFRSLGLSFQEVGIVLLGTARARYRKIRAFAFGLGCLSSAGLAAIALTDLSVVWFHQVSGLSMELTRFAQTPTAILIPLPALSVLLAFQRALMVQAKNTTPITMATFVEVAGIATVLAVGIYGLDTVGVVAAAAALLIGRILGTALLLWPSWKTTRRLTRD